MEDYYEEEIVVCIKSVQREAWTIGGRIAVAIANSFPYIIYMLILKSMLFFVYTDLYVQNVCSKPNMNRQCRTSN